ALGRVKLRSAVLEKLTVDFQGAAYEGVAYDVVVEDSDARARVTVRDGTRIVLRATARYGAAKAPPDLAAEEPRAPRTTPRAEPVRAGDSFEGAYSPRRTELQEIARIYGLAERGVGEAAVAALMAASYVVGMERPGESALFSRIELSFGDAAPARIAG